MSRLIKIYDTTLRDGTQGEGVSFSMEDKVRLATRLDALGIHYIEGGWPGSNPKDLRFFRRMQDVTFKHAKLAAFSMTRRAGGAADSDANMRALLDAGAPVATIVATGAPDSRSACMLASASALPPARRVMLNAASFACLNVTSCIRRKKRKSFGLEPGHPPSM